MISKPAFSAARDSSRQVFADGQRKMFYWGDVEVSYENIKLKADYMEYDMNSGTVFARGTYDSLAHDDPDTTLAASDRPVGERIAAASVVP